MTRTAYARIALVTIVALLVMLGAAVFSVHAAGADVLTGAKLAAGKSCADGMTWTGSPMAWCAPEAPDGMTWTG